MAPREMLYMNWNKKIGMVFFFCFFISCSNKIEDSALEGKKVYNLNFFHIELPRNFYVERDTSSSHFVRVDTIKSADGETVLFFSYWDHPDCSSNLGEFLEKSREDVVREIDGQKKRTRSVILSAHHIPNPKSKMWERDLCLRFYYVPEQVDTAICENIIRSAKIHNYDKGYLFNAHMAETDSPDGEDMSRLRDKPIENILSLIKWAELDPVANQKMFKKNGKYLFLADCFLEDEYKGTFYVNDLCKAEWNGQPADMQDIEDLLKAMKNEFANNLMAKCKFSL